MRSLALAQQKGLFRPACSLTLRAVTAGRRSSTRKNLENASQ